MQATAASLSLREVLTWLRADKPCQVTAIVSLTKAGVYIMLVDTRYSVCYGFGCFLLMFRWAFSLLAINANLKSCPSVLSTAIAMLTSLPGL